MEKIESLFVFLVSKTNLVGFGKMRKSKGNIYVKIVENSLQLGQILSLNLPMFL